MTRGVKSDPCSVESCDRPGNGGSGFCRKHVQRYRAHGDPLGGGDRYETPEEALRHRTQRLDNGCLVWTGASYPETGYGQIRADGRPQRVHVYAWTCVNGPVPDGFMLDHRCHNRLCVELTHLRLATRLQNNTNKSKARSDSRTGIRGVSRHGNGYRVSVKRGGQLHPACRTYPTIEEATAVALRARAEWFGEFSGDPVDPRESACSAPNSRRPYPRPR